MNYPIVDPAHLFVPEAPGSGFDAWDRMMVSLPGLEPVTEAPTAEKHDTLPPENYDDWDAQSTIELTEDGHLQCYYCHAPTSMMRHNTPICGPCHERATRR